MRSRPAVAAAFLASMGCATNDPASFSSDAIIFPATLLEAYRLAEGLAVNWSENAFPTSLGGGFTVMNASGEARNHSFEFHVRDRFVYRRLVVHLFAGSPWLADANVGEPPPALVDFEDMVDSDVVVPIAIDIADVANAAVADSIPVTELFAARLQSVAVWPEPADGVVPESVAWRVDFLELDILEATESPVYWSTARFYFDPYTAELLGPPVIPPSGREIYPFP